MNNSIINQRFQNFSLWLNAPQISFFLRMIQNHWAHWSMTTEIAIFVLLLANLITNCLGSLITQAIINNITHPLTAQEQTISAIIIKASYFLNLISLVVLLSGYLG